MRAGAAITVFWILSPLGDRLAVSQTNVSFNGYSLVDNTGAIQNPIDFSKSYESLGVIWAVDPGAGDQMRSSFASPGAISAFAQTGKFADGTVLVRQVVGTTQDRPASRAPNPASGVTEWFVMIKDSKGRYQGSQLWGNGWGWALFKSSAPKRQIVIDYRKECLGCHVTAKQDDWVFVKEHPSLKKK
jgi:hypothetical protein